MGFDVSIQRTTSEKNKIGKSITTIATVSGTLKDNCSIIDPVILLDYDMAAIVNANYCSIPTFGRKYFIRDIVSIRAALCEIHCHVDVLETYKNEILANEAVVRRQENQWNLYLDDGLFHIYNVPDIIVKKFPNALPSSQYILATVANSI